MKAKKIICIIYGTDPYFKPLTIDFAYCNKQYLVTSSSSPLEIELHDCEAEQKCKGHCEKDRHQCNNPQKVMMEAKVLFNELLRSMVSAINLGLDITKL